MYSKITVAKYQMWQKVRKKKNETNSETRAFSGNEYPPPPPRRPLNPEWTYKRNPYEITSFALRKSEMRMRAR